MCEGYERNSLPSIGSEGSISSLLTEADPSIRCDGSLSWRLNRLDDCTTNNDQGNLAKETTQSSCAPFKRMISDDSSRTTASIESDHSLSSTVAAGFICISDKGTSEPKLNLRLRERSEPRHRCPLVNGSLTGIARPSRYSTRVNSMATSTLFPQAHLARRFLSSNLRPNPINLCMLLISTARIPNQPLIAWIRGASRFPPRWKYTYLSGIPCRTEIPPGASSR
jgi:hypothetical protein